jgi:hypothetical protein
MGAPGPEGSRAAWPLTFRARAGCTTGARMRGGNPLRVGILPGEGGTRQRGAAHGDEAREPTLYITGRAAA